MSEFNAPGMIAPPHFIPDVDDKKCTYCGKCAVNCPMGAFVIDTKGKVRRHLTPRCIGCGLCALACDREHAVSMKAAPDYRPPFKSSSSLMARAIPGMLKTSWRVWRKYR